MLNAELTQAIDTTIEDNKDKENVWEIYEACKKTIRECQNAGLYDIDRIKYQEAISHITEKLKI
jgi:hypothetical protein